MKTKKHLITLLILTVALPASAQTEVLTGIMRGKDYGVTYMLPKTELQFTATVTHHTYTRGEYADYAKRYLHLDDGSFKATDSWTLDSIKVEVAGVPDKERTYFVKLKDRTVAPLMQLTADGIVQSINVPTAQQRRPQAVLPPPAEPAATPAPVDPNRYMTEEMLLATSNARRAELVAKEIFNIRESRNNLLRGEAETMPQDGEQLKLMLDNLNRQEAALTELFVGRSHSQTTTRTWRVEPKVVKQKVLFRFSEKVGVLESDVPESGNPESYPVLLTLIDLKDIVLPESDGKKQTEGVAYNVPGRGRLVLTCNGSELLRTEVPVTQFGVVEYLAPVLFNKNSTIQVTFNPVTGGLLKVDRETTK
ncbi:MAG: DUF4831 family protein [Prevotellaceae bacterium]|jgi:hypothetical protein|nr:DUF4831 family protein [Prevotellaceae bacterium]